MNRTLGDCKIGDKVRIWLDDHGNASRTSTSKSLEAEIVVRLADPIGPSIALATKNELSLPNNWYATLPTLNIQDEKAPYDPRRHERFRWFPRDFPIASDPTPQTKPVKISDLKVGDRVRWVNTHDAMKEVREATVISTGACNTYVGVGRKAHESSINGYLLWSEFDERDERNTIHPNLAAPNLISNATEYRRGHLLVESYIVPSSLELITDTPAASKALPLTKIDSDEAYQREMEENGICTDCQGHGQDMGDGSTCASCNGTGETLKEEPKTNPLATLAMVGGALLGAALSQMTKMEGVRVSNTVETQIDETPTFEERTHEH